MNEEVYLQNLVFKKTHDDKGFVRGEIIFKNSISLEEYTNIQEKKELILCDKLQNNWNELKKWLEEEIKETEQLSREDNTEERKILLGCYNFVKRKMLKLEKMQELEQGKNE